jgi:hypothetical protein
MRLPLSATIVYRTFVLLILLHRSAAVDSCRDYAKGNFGPKTITTEAICQQACQTAEGLPIGRFTSEDEPSNYAKCTCLGNQDGADSTSDTRDLCEDGVPTGAGEDGTPSGTGQLVVRSGVALTMTALILASVASI